MKPELIHSLTETFEGNAQQTETGVEYWLARDLQHLLGYSEWRNFHQTAISKAKTACEISGHAISDHFVDVNKMVPQAKDFATEITIHNARQHQMSTKARNSSEHIANNQAVRNTLLERGIRLESLPPEEDVKKVERRLSSEERKSLQNPDTLE
jgi:hypothetical protein